MYARLLKRPFEINNSFFLFGPRGTGKTTLLKTVLNSQTSIYLDLLDASLYQALLSKPERLKQYITDFQKWIILDEIQKIPALLDEVHRLIENKKAKFILTGSSARSLRKKGVNLLAGRALVFHMHPLTAMELGSDFNLQKSLHYGNLPAVYRHPTPDEFLKSYIQNYLKEEVLQEGLTRNIGNFARFLETASFSQGSVLNMSEISREAMVERKVIASYFQILEDLLIAIRLPVFSKKAKRRLVTHHKFYFFDVGIFRAIRPQGILDGNEEIEGPSLETLFLQEALAINEYFNYEYQFYYWRTATGLEVDFILYGPKGFMAIEIKRATHINNKSLKGLKAFGEEYPSAKLLLLYCGDYEQNIGNIHVIPISTALKKLSDLFQNI